MGGGGGLRKIRILNGAIAILEIIQNQPFRCVFVGDMPIFLNGGKAPMVSVDPSRLHLLLTFEHHPIDIFDAQILDLILIPQPDTQTPPNITNIFCRYQSTRFKFCFDRNQLRYVDLTGGIPAGKQNWCEVRITVQASPPQLGFDNVVEIYGIPAVHIFVLFIDTLQDLLRTKSRMPWPTKSQIKKLEGVMVPLSKNVVVPLNLDQARTALSVLKQLTAILSGLTQFQNNKNSQVTNRLRKITGEVEDWMKKAHRASVDDEGKLSPVTQDVDEPSSAVGEDRDESDDWVEVTLSAGVIEMHGNDSYSFRGGEPDEVFDFELLGMD